MEQTALNTSSNRELINFKSDVQINEILFYNTTELKPIRKINTTLSHRHQTGEVSGVDEMEGSGAKT